MTGQTISHYRILEKLGEGGMGVVYKAEDVHMHRLVALKFLHASEDLARLLREAQTAGALSHPNICTVYGVDPERGFIAMEYVEGRTLSKLIDGRPLRVDDALQLARQIGEGLRAAHERGITHRDIKSGNVIVTEKGQAKLLDFGLARIAGQTALTREGLAAGTPGYMAPEQIRGEPADRRTDIWAFGALLHEMLTGRLPIGSVGDLPQGIDRAVGKALAADPAERYQHIEDMLVDLRGTRSPSPAALPDATPRQHGRALWIAGAVACLAIAAAGWFGYRTMRLESARSQLQEARRMAELGQGVEAARRVRKLRVLLKGDPELESFWQEYTTPLAIQTIPAGADVSIKEYLSENDDWEHLGKSPVENFRRPFPALRARFTLEGYEPAEVVLSGNPYRAARCRPAW